MGCADKQATCLAAVTVPAENAGRTPEQRGRRRGGPFPPRSPEPRRRPRSPAPKDARCGQRMASATGQDVPMTQQTPTAPASRAARRAYPGEVNPHLTGPGTLRLPAVPWAAAVTRRYLRQLLRGWQLGAVTETAQLMASELVANAVTAARAPEGGALLDERQPQSQPI